jgi:hypothetical protein
MMQSFAFLLVFFTSCCGHTWLDCTKDVGTGLNTGIATCDGFARGYPGRVTGVDIDRVMTYRIQPRIDGENPPICAANQRLSSQYSTTYPMAQAAPGETLRMRWTPNGHQRGAGQDPKTYTIHWTGQPNTQLNNRKDLNAANTLAGPNMFDAECFCNNCAGNPCYGYFTIPQNTAPGVYSFIYYWVFDRDPNGGGEEYTTCFDVQVTGANVQPQQPPSPQTSKDQLAPSPQTSNLQIPQSAIKPQATNNPTAQKPSPTGINFSGPPNLENQINSNSGTSIANLIMIPLICAVIAHTL